MSKAWDEAAIQALKSRKHETECYSYYMRNLYRKSTEIGLKHVKSEEINLLKVDLWNEGIASQRNVLGRYQNNKNFCLYGIDISKIVCSNAKSKTNNVQIVHATIEKLPFKTNFFDIILDPSTLDHVSETKAINVLQEYKRVLKKNGILVLVFRYKSLAITLVRALNRKKAQNSMLRYFFSMKFVEKAKKRFEILEVYSAGTYLSIGGLLDRLPMRVRNSILDSFLTLKYWKSKTSKLMLKVFGGFYVIIGAKPTQ